LSRTVTQDQDRPADRQLVAGSFDVIST